MTPSTSPATPAPRRSPAGPWLIVAMLAAVLVACVVQRRALGVYFTPDDLLQLERARGLLPWPVSAWRWLSGFVWVRASTSAFGADPGPYHAANLALHGGNVVLLFALARRQGASIAAAFVAALVFGAWRVHGTALASAASAGELLALGLMLAALLAWGRGLVRMALAAGLALLALLAKESVLLLPFALLVRPARDGEPQGRSRLLLAVATLSVGAVLLAIGRSSSGSIGGEAYTVGFGGNVFRSLGLLAEWTVDLVGAIPDHMGAADSGAWRAGLAAAAVFALAGWWLRTRAPLVTVGAAWWALAVLPVLPLVHQIYLHYLVAPAAGLALAAAGLADAWPARKTAGRGAKATRSAAPAWTRPAALATLALAWAGWHDHLLDERYAARLPGTDTPSDPVLRKTEVARRLIEDTRAALGGRRARVAYMVLDGTQETLDLATGEHGRTGEEARLRNSVEAALGEDGLAVRALLPNVDSVLYVHQLDRSLAGWECFVPGSENHLQAIGQPPQAFETLGSALVNGGLAGPALQLLERANADWPDRPGLRFVRAMALARLGERDRALAGLRELVAASPADSFAARAREILTAEGVSAP